MHRIDASIVLMLDRLRHSFMSDIPLRKLRRHKNRGDYTPLDDPGDSESRIALHSPSPEMPRLTTIGTAANARRNRTARARYADDPEEEAQLLGGAEYDVEEEDSEERSGSLSPVSRETIATVRIALIIL